MTIKLKEVIVDFVLGLLVVSFNYFNNSADATIIHRLLDGTFVAGVLLTGIGILLFCANKGAFNIFGYGVKYGLSLILPIGKNPWAADGERETYYDYCMRKAEKEPKSFLPLLISGGVYLVISVVLLVIYLNA